MRSAVGWCVLGLLGLHSSVWAQTGVLIFCDDPSVEKAVHSALSRFNQAVVSGHKLALYRILSANKAENGSDSVYSLQFTSRRSDCPAGSSKAWTECDYLPSRSKKPISCNATVLMMETQAETQQVDCKIEEQLLPERASCMGCPEPIHHNSDDLKLPVSASIARFNLLSNSSHLFSLHEVGQATRQVVAGFRYKVSFDVKKTNCSKEEHKDLHDQCVHDQENQEFANCNSTVDTAPWRLETPAVQIQCQPGSLPPMMVQKGFYHPGFTPLRAPPPLPDSSPSFSSSSSSSPSPSPSPSLAPAKEESSEEDLGPSSSPSLEDNPFHCPSKPWKAFRPLPAGPPGGDAAPSKAPQSSFSDSDLLGGL